MRLTNRQNLPEAIVRAVSNDSYNAGKSDISVTSLIAPPRIFALKKQHRGELVEDVADRIWSLIGQATHTVIERAKSETDLVEKRLFTEVEGWTISGQFDYWSHGALIDWKTTSVWSVIHGDKPEWEKQLNCLDYLCNRNGIFVEKLQIIAILKDWSKMKARTDKGYPQKQVVVIDVPKWSEEQQREYLTERVRAHQSALKELPECEDRWERPSKWAVMKPNRKSAVRLLDSEEEAHAYAKQKEVKGYYLVYRQGEPIRCKDYCSVAPYCEQYQRELENE